MAEANDDGGSLHIAVFPWLAFGHMLPFLALSKSLAQKGHRVSFLSTPRNIQRLPVTSSPSLIHFVPLPLHPAAGLPETAAATSDIPPTLIPLLTKSLDSLQSHLASFLTVASPDWIIHDFVNHWVSPVAAAAGVPSIFFSVFPAASLAFLGPADELNPDTTSRRYAKDFTFPPPWLPPDSNLAFRLHEAQWAVNASRPNASGVSTIHRLMKALQDSKAVAIRSCRELEADWLRLLPDLYSKPVIPVGLLPPPAAFGDEKDEILEWLDGRAAGSVLYIAFGSEVELSTEQLQRLALGVELSGVAFLWAMRKGVEELPDGFLGRTSGRGVVDRGWVDQIGVLSREAVGGFLSHCGPSSVVEGIRFGRPLVLFPVFADQGIIARVMAGKGVGAEVERREEDGNFGKEDVARAVRLVMVGEEGEAMRSRARDLSREIFANDDCHNRYVDDFIEYLRNNRR